MKQNLKNIFAITLLFIAQLKSSSSSSYSQPNFQNQMNTGYSPHYGYHQGNLGHQLNLQPQFNPQQQNQFQPSVYHNGAGNSSIPQRIGETFLVSNVPLMHPQVNYGIQGSMMHSYPEMHFQSQQQQFLHQSHFATQSIPNLQAFPQQITFFYPQNYQLAYLLNYPQAGASSSSANPTHFIPAQQEESIEAIPQGPKLFKSESDSELDAEDQNSECGSGYSSCSYKSSDLFSSNDDIQSSKETNIDNESNQFKPSLGKRIRKQILNTSDLNEPMQKFEELLAKIDQTTSTKHSSQYNKLLIALSNFGLHQLVRIFEDNLSLQLNRHFKKRYQIGFHLEELVKKVASNYSYEPEVTNNPKTDHFFQSMMPVVRYMCDRAFESLSKFVQDPERTDIVKEVHRLIYQEEMPKLTINPAKARFDQKYPLFFEKALYHNTNKRKYEIKQSRRYLALRKSITSLKRGFEIANSELISSIDQFINRFEQFIQERGAYSYRDYIILSSSVKGIIAPILDANTAYGLKVQNRNPLVGFLWRNSTLINNLFSNRNDNDQLLSIISRMDKYIMPPNSSNLLRMHKDLKYIIGKFQTIAKKLFEKL